VPASQKNADHSGKSGRRQKTTGERNSWVGENAKKEQQTEMQAEAGQGRLGRECEEVRRRREKRRKENAKRAQPGPDDDDDAKKSPAHLFVCLFCFMNSSSSPGLPGPSTTCFSRCNPC
jgi:hypothetical protein